MLTKRWMSGVGVAACLVGLALLAGVVRADDGPACPASACPASEAAASEASPAPDAVITQAALADALAEYGRENKTPEALVTAALILSKLPVADAGQEDGAEPKPCAEHAKQVESLLREAAKMRPGDDVLKQLVDRVLESNQERSRALFDIGKLMRRIRIQVARNQRKVVATVSKKRGETISASVPQPVGVGVVLINPNGSQGPVIKTGTGSVATTAPSSGTYGIVIMPGQVALSTTLSLR